jgi:hypothetical protein
MCPHACVCVSSYVCVCVCVCVCMRESACVFIRREREGACVCVCCPSPTPKLTPTHPPFSTLSTPIPSPSLASYYLLEFCYVCICIGILKTLFFPASPFLHKVS